MVNHGRRERVEKLKIRKNVFWVQKWKITSSPEFVSEPFVSELFEWLDPPHESSFLAPVPIMTGPENGLVWFKLDPMPAEPVRTGSCWILCWTEPRSDAIALGALLCRLDSAWAEGPCGCQNWPIAESDVDWPIGNGLLFPIWVGWSLAAKLAWYICNIDDISCSIWSDFWSEVNNFKWSDQFPSDHFKSDFFRSDLLKMIDFKMIRLKVLKFD